MAHTLKLCLFVYIPRTTAVIRTCLTKREHKVVAADCCMQLLARPTARTQRRGGEGTTRQQRRAHIRSRKDHIPQQQQHEDTHITGSPAAPPRRHRCRAGCEPYLPPYRRRAKKVRETTIWYHGRHITSTCCTKQESAVCQCVSEKLARVQCNCICVRSREKKKPQERRRTHARTRARTPHTHARTFP